jgi:hypothetical protein
MRAIEWALMGLTACSSGCYGVGWLERSSFRNDRAAYEAAVRGDGAAAAELRHQAVSQQVLAHLKGRPRSAFRTDVLLE